MTETMTDRITLELEPADSLRLANLCGQFDGHLKQIESRLGIVLFCRGNLFTLEGDPDNIKAAKKLLQNLYRLSETEIQKISKAFNKFDENGDG